MKSLLDALSEAAMMPIPPAYHDGVADNLARLTVQARLLMEFELPQDTEPAGLFCPTPILPSQIRTGS